MNVDEHRRSRRRIVRLRLDHGAECLGLWSSAGGLRGAVVLLHDLGGDLDRMLALEASLVATGVDVLSLDLPGHGLSGGRYWRDGVAAVEAAAEVAAAHGNGLVGYVAQGASTALLRGTESTHAVAAFLLDPRDDQAAPDQRPGWSRVPSTVVQDPMDAAAEAYVDAILAKREAWTLRVHLHRTGGPGSEGVDLSTGDARIASPQVVTSATKFLLEQLTYARAATRTPRGARGSDAR